MNTLKIRLVEVNDKQGYFNLLPADSEIRKESQEEEAYTWIHEIINDNSRSIYVCEDNGQIKGAITLSEEEEYGKLSNFFADPESQQLLLEQMIEFASIRKLHGLSSRINSDNREVFLKLGFKESVSPQEDGTTVELVLHESYCKQ